MRVTNEQATSDKICELYCPDCELSLSKPEDWKCPHGETSVRKYAADLLEARELIKEMRSALEVVRDNTRNTAHTLTMLGLQETTNANHRLSLAILERTKEYQ